MSSYRKIWTAIMYAGSYESRLTNDVCITMASYWARWRLKSPASPLFAQPFIRAQIKENIKTPHNWPLWGEFTGEFPAKRASNAENVSTWWRQHGLFSTCKRISHLRPTSLRCISFFNCQITDLRQLNACSEQEKTWVIDGQIDWCMYSWPCQISYW